MSDSALIEATTAAHVFASSSRARGGRIENFAGCTCGHPLAWRGREEAHREHVLIELARAVREQIAWEIEAQIYPHPTHNAFVAGEIEAGREAARIARGES